MLTVHIRVYKTQMYTVLGNEEG